MDVGQAPRQSASRLCKRISKETRAEYYSYCLRSLKTALGRLGSALGTDVVQPRRNRATKSSSNCSIHGHKHVFSVPIHGAPGTNRVVDPVFRSIATAFEQFMPRGRSFAAGGVVAADADKPYWPADAVSTHGLYR